MGESEGLTSQLPFMSYSMATYHPHSKGVTIVAATREPFVRVYVTVTPGGSHDRGIVLW